MAGATAHSSYWVDQHQEQLRRDNARRQTERSDGHSAPGRGSAEDGVAEAWFAQASRVLGITSGRRLKLWKGAVDGFYPESDPLVAGATVLIRSQNNAEASRARGR